ncbi:hypothetical protein AAIS05_16355 [Mycobacterium tuberculosis]|uniref:AfsR/SARP family transcriptional regulator n=1 Tax=Mycobacterium tuberculosis TaxID=1773 RepID=UPI0031CC8D09
MQFNVLGPLELNLRGTKLPLGTPKQRAVLAMLLLSRNQVVAADALVQAPTIRALYHKILRQLPMDDLVGRVTRGRVDLRGGNGAKVEELTESDKDLLPIGLA